MTLFQAVVFTIIHQISTFFPLSPEAHQTIVSEIFGWSRPEGGFLAVMSASALLALLLYFRHELLSAIASTLQVMLFIRKPQSPDDRLLVYLALASLGWGALQIAQIQWPLDPLSSVPVALIGGSLFYVFAERRSKQQKHMLSWTWRDALFTGVLSSALFVPGFGALIVFMIAGHLRNFRRETVAKFALLALLPQLLSQTIHYFSDPMPESGVSWLTYGVCGAIGVVLGLIALDGFAKQAQKIGGLRNALLYRVVLGLGFLVFLMIR
jgi:undecaprenyl-diphosphatase